MLYEESIDILETTEDLLEDKFVESHENHLCNEVTIDVEKTQIIKEDKFNESKEDLLYYEVKNEVEETKLYKIVGSENDLMRFEFVQYNCLEGEYLKKMF